MNRTISRRPVAHVPAAAALIGGLAVLLAAGLHALKVLARIDALVAARLSEALGQTTAAGFAKSLPEWLIWSGTVVIAFGLALAMLSAPGNWRRVVLWLTTLILVAAWAPVLALAAHVPTVSAPVIAVIWVGLCVWFHARTHILPADQPEAPPARPPRAHPL